MLESTVNVIVFEWEFTLLVHLVSQHRRKIRLIEGNVVI
jgi:hypothetical protein